MITINLLRESLCASDNDRVQVLRKVPLEPFPSVLQSSALPPSLHPRLMERLLGKSPLRLIAKRVELFKGCYEETLECGHQTTTYQEFLWDDKAHLVWLPPSARRRRCRACRLRREDAA